MLELKDVRLQYVKDYYALCDINLTFEKGKIYNIVGAVGAGKASLLRCVAKLEQDYEGEILFNGKNIKEIDFSLDLGVGFVPEVPVLLDKKDVVENLKFALVNRQICKSLEEENYLISQLLPSFELENFTATKVSKLQYFEKQKIAFARLSLRKIDILLVENIFDLIDSNQINMIKKYLEDYFISENSIIILASSYSLNEYFEDLNVIEMNAGCANIK